MTNSSPVPNRVPTPKPTVIESIQISPEGATSATRMRVDCGDARQAAIKGKDDYGRARAPQTMMRYIHGLDSGSGCVDSLSSAAENLPTRHCRTAACSIRNRDRGGGDSAPPLDTPFMHMSYFERGQGNATTSKFVSSLRSTSQFGIAGVSRVAISIGLSDKSRTNCRHL